MLCCRGITVTLSRSCLMWVCRMCFRWTVCLIEMLTFIIQTGDACKFALKPRCVCETETLSIGWKCKTTFSQCCKIIRSTFKLNSKEKINFISNDYSHYSITQLFDAALWKLSFLSNVFFLASKSLASIFFFHCQPWIAAHSVGV